MVEFTIVLLILLVLVFGIIEFGLLMKDYLTLGHAAREGARSASLGSPTGIVIDRIQKTASALSGGLPTADISLQKSSDGGTTWGPLGDTGGSPNENNASTGQMLRVKLTYHHQLVAGGIMPFHGDAQGKVNIAGNMVMRRETTAPPPTP